VKAGGWGWGGNAPENKLSFWYSRQ